MSVRQLAPAAETLATGGASTALTALVYASFAATGAGCALPGVLLPLLHLQVNDGRTGGVFFLIALGSMLGPVALGRRPEHRLLPGLALLVLAAAGWGWRPDRPAVCGFGWGLGLGMVMTALSLLSPALPKDNGIVLMRLNFLWAVGAWCCPPAVGIAARALGVRWIPGEVALLAALVGVAMLLLVQQQAPGTWGRGGETRSAGWSLRDVPLALVLATALAPGIEASAGAWLATYASRALHTLWFTLTVPACFWGGLLASRALGWLPGFEPGKTQNVRTLLVMVVSGAGLLLLPTRPWALPVEGFLLGFGLGPLYPLMLARVLKVRVTSAIFVLAGLASSIMPWATGLLSQRSGSLRTGLLVPLLGAVLLTVTGWRVDGRGERRHGRAWTSV